MKTREALKDRKKSPQIGRKTRKGTVANAKEAGGGKVKVRKGVVNIIDKK